MALGFRKNGKTLYAVPYCSFKGSGVRYLLASDSTDAMTQVITSRRLFPKGCRIMGVAPAIGAYEKDEERKRIYSTGF